LCAALSVFAASQLRDYTNKDISREYDDMGAAPGSGHAGHAA